MTGYKIEIIKVDNGFTVRLDNCSAPSKVFRTIDEVIGFVKGYFTGKITTVEDIT